MEEMSPYQQRIASLAACGLSNRQIACELNTSEQAVKSALHTIFEKTGIRNRVDFANKIPHGNPQLDPIEDERALLIRMLLKGIPKVEHRLQDLVELAALAFEVPIALVTLVGSNVVHVVSGTGLDVREAKREYTFCDHAIRQSNVFVVGDASKDPRFCNNVFVVAPPHIRFYAGAPITSGDGYPLGYFCVIDHRPRQLRPRETALLKRFGELTLSILSTIPAGDSAAIESSAA